MLDTASTTSWCLKVLVVHLQQCTLGTERAAEWQGLLPETPQGEGDAGCVAWVHRGPGCVVVGIVATLLGQPMQGATSQEIEGH